MKPEIPSTNLTPEQLPAPQVVNIEQKYSLNKSEFKSSTSVEKGGQKTENGAVVADVNFTTVLPAPVIDDTGVANDTTIVIDSPLVAADDDLIEKEWVDKAKKIVNETKDNPHQQEKAVNKLQIDYLKKRYGRELGVIK